MLTILTNLIASRISETFLKFSWFGLKLIVNFLNFYCKITITAAEADADARQGDERDKQYIEIAPFTDCIGEIDHIQVDKVLI